MLRMLTDLLAWTGALAQHRRGARALAGWNDHELADIGLVEPMKPRDLHGGPVQPPERPEQEHEEHLPAGRASSFHERVVGPEASRWQAMAGLPSPNADALAISRRAERLHLVHRPRRRVVARVLDRAPRDPLRRPPAARRGRGSEGCGRSGRPGVARPAVPLVVPEREHGLVWVQRPDRVGPALVEEAPEGGAGLGPSSASSSQDFDG